jgi:guanylate cyclase
MSGGLLVLGAVGPLYALMWPDRRRAVVLLVAHVGTAAAYVPLRSVLSPAGGSGSPVGELLFVAALLACSLSSFLAILYFVLERARLLKLVQVEQEKAERLLLNILPKPIADVLRDDSRTIADFHSSASVLFADLVGFTPLSSTMEPREVVGLLNEVFSYFDSLVDRHGLEKIKTIGDCYMAAAGLPEPRDDHAQALVSMALDARDELSRRTFAGRRLHFRMGINSGPVVAGVIGAKRFIYDLWGDAVNTASRMESHGEANAIQITESTYRLIRDTYICEARGVISVKGKGDMPVWHVLGRRTTETAGAEEGIAGAD